MPRDRILVVDDNKMIFDVIKNIFKKEEVDFDYSGNFKEAVNKVKNNEYKIAIVDYDLSEDKNGLDLLNFIKSNSLKLPVILISGDNSADDKNLYLEEGAISFVSKPFYGPELYLTIRNMLNLLSAYQGLEEAGSIIKALSSALDSRDSYTEGHSIRVLEFSLMLYDALGYKDIEERSSIKLGAILHDIGKIGIPDNILQSKERLSEEQYQIIKKHPVIGYNICKNIKNLQLSIPIIRHHHEKIDGSGYPDGLKNNEVSHAVHIVTIADIFDALTTARTYREAFSIEKAIQVLYKEASDGKLSKYFVEVFDKLVKEKTKGKIL